MPDFVTLSCPTCGGQLQITQDIDRFACAHCGNEHVVKRGGGIVSLAPVVAGLDGIQRGTDRIAAELAIPRLKKEIGELEEEMLPLANQLCKSDYYGMYSELKKQEGWKKLPWKVRVAPIDERTIVGLSADEIEELSKRYLNRFRLFGRKPGDEAAFETMIGLKRQVEQRQSELARHERVLVADC